MSTPRLLNLHCKLTPQFGVLSYYANPDQCFPAEHAAWAAKELTRLAPFRDTLHRVLATREHVERRSR